MSDDLHFKTGKMGWLARFFVRRRAVGDPYDETLILPALIFVAVARLNDLKRLDDWTVVAALIITGIVSGAWLGASVGLPGSLRVVLRGISVGLIEAAGYAAINERIDRSNAFNLALSLVYMNFTLFWFSHSVVSTFREVAVISEKQWQAGSARRAWMHKVIRIALGAEDLKGESTYVAAIVWAIRWLVPLLVLGGVAWLFGVSPMAFLKSRVAP